LSNYGFPDEGIPEIIVGVKNLASLWPELDITQIIGVDSTASADEFV
jgi:hypothetical protein